MGKKKVNKKKNCHKAKVLAPKAIHLEVPSTCQVEDSVTFTNLDGQQSSSSKMNRQHPSSSKIDQQCSSTSEVNLYRPSTSKTDFQIPANTNNSDFSFTILDDISINLSDISMADIHSKLKGILDNCFKGKSEISVKRDLFEELVAESVRGYISKKEIQNFPCQINELTTKCQVLQERFKQVNRLRYAFKKQVEDASHIIKKLVEEQYLYNLSYMERRRPKKPIKLLRSICVQVGTDELPVTMDGTPYVGGTANTSSNLENNSIKICNYKPSSIENLKSSSSNLSSTNDLNSNERSQFKEDANHCKTLQKENVGSNSQRIGNLSDDHESKARKPNVKSKSGKPNVKNKEYVILNDEAIVISSDEEVEEIVLNKGNHNGAILKETFKEKYPEVKVKQEVIEEDSNYETVIVDEDIPCEISCDTNLIHVKKENEDTDTETQHKEVDESNLVSTCTSEATNDEAAADMRPLKIRVRTPESINEQLSKEADLKLSSQNNVPCPSSILALEGGFISFSSLPPYPDAPIYPPNVNKPPAPSATAAQRYNNGINGVMLSWKFTGNKKIPAITEYQIYSCQELHTAVYESSWRKIGSVSALPLPMACFLSHFQLNHRYQFIVRAVDLDNILGDFSLPAGIVMRDLGPSEIPSVDFYFR